MEIKIIDNQQEFFENIFQELVIFSAGKKINVGLSGGSIKNLYHFLNQQNLPWDKISFFQTDERYVSNENPDSNQKMISENLSKCSTCYFFNADLSIEAALNQYENMLPQNGLDLCFLGIGPDGHIASIFPNQKTGNENFKTLHSQTEVFSVKDRLSLSLDYLLKSEKIIFVIQGPEKKALIKELQNPQKTATEFPAHHFRNHPNCSVFYLTA